MARSGCVLGHRAGAGAVAVEVVDHHELGPNSGHTVDDPFEHVRELLSPAVVRRLGRHVHDAGILDRTSDALVAGDVGGGQLNTVGEVGLARAVHGPDPQTGVEQCPSDGISGAAGGAEDDVQVGAGHGFLPST